MISMEDCCIPCVTRAWLVYAIVASLLSASAQSTAAANSDSLPKLLLISFDGFGWNYFGKLPRSQLPHFNAFIEKGVHVRWVENVFPTETRPNHMSLVSGLYTESHGIVANHVYDPTLHGEIPREGKLQKNDSKWVDVGAEPVWVTNSKTGNGRRSGTIQWPCSDARIKGRLPEESRRGGWSVTEEVFKPNQRIDLALDWLTGKSVEPLNFVALYFSEPDEISHKFGVDSQEVLDAIVSRDQIVGYLMSQMKEKNLEEKLNVIITADHGHLPIYPQVTINIDLLLDPSWYTIYSNLSHGYPFLNVWPKEGYYTRIVDTLKKKNPLNLHIATSDNSEDLLELHYLTNRRIPPIVLWGEPGWVIVNNKTKSLSKRGTHGWDPRYSPHMYPMFIAMGPAFKKGVRNAKPLHIVDIYPLMCHILELKPAPNNGSLSNTEHILSQKPPSPESQSSSPALSNYTGVGIGVLVIILAVVIIVVIIRYVRTRNRTITASYKRAFTKEGSKDDLMDDGTLVLSDEEL